MRYLPHTPDDIRDMLDAIGIRSLDELFAPIPDELRLKRPLDLPEPMPECRLRSHLEALAAGNLDVGRVASFAGAGIYNHHVPAAIAQLLLRSEFYTAYTPYQPEVSQGTLQAIFEYQTMVARLLGMEVANASLYDGSTATAEAVRMALRIFRHMRPRVVVAGALHPEYAAVTRTTLEDPDGTLTFVPHGPDGRADRAALDSAMGPDVAAILVQHPNFFGLLEDIEALRAVASAHEALLAVVFSEPLAFGMIKPPGAYGADIAAGEGQSFGLPPSFGGPLLGMMATAKAFVRSVPGRLVGRTSDRRGNQCFVVTLSTREQHIRREKATSNICTNEGLCALAASVYLSLLGPEGLSRLARLNHHASRFLAAELARIPGISLPFGTTPWFNEFVVELPEDATAVWERLHGRGLVAGVPLARFHPGREDMRNRLLLAVTELNSKEEMLRLCSELRSL